MSSLSPRLQVRVKQKQILTPGLVQMVSLLQLNRLELKEMISGEVAQNPVLEESLAGGESQTIPMRLAEKSLPSTPVDDWFDEKKNSTATTISASGRIACSRYRRLGTKVSQNTTPIAATL